MHGHDNGVLKLSGKLWFKCKVSLNGSSKQLWNPEALTEAKIKFLFNLLSTSSNNAYTTILTFMLFPRERRDNIAHQLENILHILQSVCSVQWKRPLYNWKEENKCYFKECSSLNYCQAFLLSTHVH